MAAAFDLLAMLVLALARGVSGGVLLAAAREPACALEPHAHDGVVCWGPDWKTRGDLVTGFSCDWLAASVPVPCHCGEGSVSELCVQLRRCDLQRDDAERVRERYESAYFAVHYDKDKDVEATSLMQRGKRPRSSSPRRRRRHRREEETRRQNRQRWLRPSTAPVSRTTTCSVVRFPPRRPWTRRSAGESLARGKNNSEMVDVEVSNDGVEDTRARGSRDPPPPIPTLDSLEPGVSWWADLIGMTNPLEEEDGEQRIINEDTFRTIVANLQGQGREERNRNIGSLLSCFGLFLAEMMRAVWEAENGDLQVLLQVSASWQTSVAMHDEDTESLHGDDVFFMQRMLGKPDLDFHAVIRQIQKKMESMSKAGAARIARCMGHFLHEHSQRKGVKRPEGAMAKFETIGALMAAFEDNQLVTHEEVDPWCIDISHNTLLQFLQEETHAEMSCCCWTRG